MSNFSNNKKLCFNIMPKNYVRTSRNIKIFDAIPYVTDLYSDNYSQQNIDNGTNHGLYTYWGDYYVNDKLFFNDIQIDEHDININSIDRDTNINFNPLNFTVWLNPGPTKTKSFLPRVFKNVKYINFEHIVFPKYIQLNKFNFLSDPSSNLIINDISNNFTFNANHNDNISKINLNILDYQICNVISRDNYLEVSITINFKKSIVYTYIRINDIITLDKFKGIYTNSPGNHIQYICIQPTNNKFIYNTKNKSVFRQVFPKLTKNSSLYIGIKKSFIVYKNTDLLNVYKLDIKLLDFNYEPIIINNLDHNIETNKCLCNLDDTIKYSCSCYYLRHPLNLNFQIDIFLKFGCLIQDLNKKSYVY